jgi:type I restriction-modification system DNA methylase subunit/predicted type IV restriction endonuclease
MIQITKEQAYKKIADLVERFGEHVDEYKRTGYNEHQTRIDYINPFFKALGWDMDNEQGYAEAYREVIHEDKIKVGGSTKAPDYGFTLFGQRKFFVDAKKPAINIKTDIHPAYQVRRYGWSAKVPLSIVTDFEEFSIYDCTKKPNPKDKASIARIKYLTYDQYLDEFDFLWDVFAKENLPKGRFDKYVKSDTKRKGTATVDKEFLKSIEEWRRYLATSIALRNRSISEDELNFAVQKIIDRIIFLRMCEDRGVEQYGELKKATQKGDIYQNLFALYRIADDKYNSGLFDLKEDKITPTLTVNNKVMKNIIKELYYPNCEFEFSVMPADILGSVYEQFLGKTIRLTKAHYAKIEEKLEVRKAGGVYYTPKYIVDYIVENTVGKLIENKTPKQVEKIKICDPACGSGSFLIGAYQYLLDWHRNHYMPDFKRLSEIASNNKNKKIGLKAQKDRKKLPLSPDGNLRTSLKKQILLNNIYGVDIDNQAVEVTKLNLLLKALEGETTSSINSEMTFGNRVLPNLNKNIKCGNSLIGNDFYDNQFDLFPEQMKKINAFDWKEGFPEVFEKGGFDVVIGNPPYIPPELLDDSVKEYFRKKYSQLQRKYDTSIVFLLAGLEKINKTGVLSFISSITWQTGENSKAIRELLFKNYGVSKIVNLPFDVFKNAYVDTGIFVIEARKTKSYDIFRYNKKEKIHSLEDIEYKTVQSELINAPDYKIILNPFAQRILERLCENNSYIHLGDITDSTQGLSGSRFDIQVKKDSNNDYPFLIIGQAYRYQLQIDEVGFTNLENKETLKKYYQAEPKLLIRRLINRQDRLVVAYTEQKMVFKKDINPFIFTDTAINPKAILGILNSSLISFLYVNTSSIATKDDFRQTTLTELRAIPIPRAIKDEKLIHMHVDNLLNLNNQLQTTKLETQRQRIQRAITHAEKKIDELVYGLYGLSEEEIKIVEGE